MQIVINISEEIYERCRKYNLHCGEAEVLEGAVANGTPLPIGHGDLIDRQALINNGIEKGFCDWYDEIKNADIIIEADKESEE